MKNLLTVFLIISLLTGTYSCQEQHKVKLIRSGNDNEYLLLKKQYNKVDKQVLGIFEFDDEQISNISTTLNKVQKLLNNKSEKEKSFKMVHFQYRLYINENGKIDKVVSLSSDSEKIDKVIAENLGYWNMNKFSINQPKKYAIDWTFAFTKQKGNKNFELLDSNLPAEKSLLHNLTDKYFLQVEEMPSPIGGVKGIQEKIHYPEIAKRAGIEGRVYVKAFIDEKGNVAEAEIIKGLGGGCDEEALKAVKGTKFIPGRQRGKPVKTQVSIPILFKLDSKNFNSDSKIVGKWEGKTNSGEIIKIKFFSDGTTNLYKSKSGRMKGKITPAIFWPKFKIDYSTTPNTLDLIYNSKSISKCLVKFVSNDEIIIALPKKLDKRPKSFNKNDVRETWKLKRIQ